MAVAAVVPTDDVFDPLVALDLEPEPIQIDHTRDELEAIRAEIHRLNRKWGLWKGIRRCIMKGGEFKQYADFQLEWQHNVLWGKDIQTVLVGCRLSTKTQITVEAIVKLMAEVPNTWVSWIPGGNMRQYEQARTYFNTLIDNSPVLSKMKGMPWQENTKTLTNGSRIMFLPPTVDGVNSMRGNVIVFDEAQSIATDVLATAVFQGGVDGSRMIFIGLSESGTKIHEVFMNKETGFRLKVEIRHILKAGLQSYNYVRHIIAGLNLPLDKIKVMYFSMWVSPSDRAFDPQIIEGELPPGMQPNVWLPLTECLGVDFNPSKMHWGIKAVQTIYGDVICVEEHFARSYNGILDWAPGVRLHAEYGGTNSGFVHALEFENSKRIGQQHIVRDEWTEEVKGDQVGECLRLQENRKLWIMLKGCPILASVIFKIPFNDKGVPDKKRAEKMELNPHVVDAFIHAVAGASQIPSTDYMMSFFEVRR